MTAAVFGHDGPWTEEEYLSSTRPRNASNSSTGAST